MGLDLLNRATRISYSSEIIINNYPSSRDRVSTTMAVKLTVSVIETIHRSMVIPTGIGDSSISIMIQLQDHDHSHLKRSTRDLPTSTLQVWLNITYQTSVNRHLTPTPRCPIQSTTPLPQSPLTIPHPNMVLGIQCYRVFTIYSIVTLNSTIIHTLLHLLLSSQMQKNILTRSRLIPTKSRISKEGTSDRFRRIRELRCTMWR